MTSLKLSEQDGFSQFMDIDVMPIYKQVSCKETSPEYDYCGDWFLPCGSISSNSSVPFDSMGNISIFDDGMFTQIVQYSPSGGGCMGELSPVVLQVYPYNFQCYHCRYTATPDTLLAMCARNPAYPYPLVHICLVVKEIVGQLGVSPIGVHPACYVVPPPGSLSPRTHILTYTYLPISPIDLH